MKNDILIIFIAIMAIGLMCAVIMDPVDESDHSRNEPALAQVVRCSEVRGTEYCKIIVDGKVCMQARGLSMYQSVSIWCTK